MNELLASPSSDFPVETEANLTRVAETLTPCQSAALAKLTGDGMVFLTGGAGTGKSFLTTRYLGARSKKEASRVPLLASTGSAAVLVGGRTFHSFFGLGIFEGGVEATIDRAIANREVVKRLRKAEQVVIDEVSMLSGSTLYAAEQIARRCRDPLMPWGGLRVIAVGDFAQLPPVEGGRGYRPDTNAKRDWAFLHRTWADSGFEVAYLKTQTRTHDRAYMEALQIARRGDIGNSLLSEFIQSRMIQEKELDPDTTRLYPRRDDADRFNLKRLSEISGESVVIDSVYSGDSRGKEYLKKAAPVPEKLHLKIGALIMMRQNDMAGKFVNGSLGHVRRITASKLVIDLLSGRSIEVERTTFGYYDSRGEPIASVINFPVSLAWATTIHKSQGATLDRLAVDLKGLWEPGQAYVALSRVRESKNLFITGWTPRSIRIDPDVSQFYRPWEV